MTATASLLGADVDAEPEVDDAEELEAEAELALELTLDISELDALADDEADESVVVLLAVPVVDALPVVEALAPSHVPTQVAPATTNPGVKL